MTSRQSSDLSSHSWRSPHCSIRSKTFRRQRSQLLRTPVGSKLDSPRYTMKWIQQYIELSSHQYRQLCRQQYRKLFTQQFSKLYSQQSSKLCRLRGSQGSQLHSEPRVGSQVPSQLCQLCSYP